MEPMQSSRDYTLETLAVREGQERSQFNEHSEALYLTSSFVFDSAAQAAARFSGEDEGNVYSRFTNPTVAAFQHRLAAEGLTVHGVEPGRDRREMVSEIMGEVGLDAATMSRYPHEFSGGQRQRIAIARAMILRPRVVVLDEPTSALDMTVQIQIVELLRGLQRKYGLAYLFISHDLRVVRALAHKVIVMKQGDIVEEGNGQVIFDAPQTAYTGELMAAAFGGHSPAGPS